MNLAAALAALFFLEKCCHWLTPGTRPRTRLLFVGLLFALAPAFIGAVFSQNPALPALAFLLGAVAFGARFWDFKHWRDGAAAALFAGFFVWEKLPALAAWSFENCWKIAPGHSLPNLAWALAPLCHPAFFLCAPLLAFGAKRTDFQLFEKKMLLALVSLNLLTVAGLPRPALADLLPAHALALLLFFPAWDRFVSYGFHFLKPRWMRAALWAFFAVQALAGVWLWGRF